MKLKGVIWRPTPNVYLRAFISQGGRYGVNILEKHKLTDVDQAKATALQELSKKGMQVQVEWSYQEGGKLPV